MTGLVLLLLVVGVPYLAIGLVLAAALHRQQVLELEYDDTDDPPAGVVILGLLVLLWLPLAVLGVPDRLRRGRS